MDLLTQIKEIVAVEDSWAAIAIHPIYWHDEGGAILPSSFHLKMQGEIDLPERMAGMLSASHRHDVESAPVWLLTSGNSSTAKALRDELDLVRIALRLMGVMSDRGDFVIWGSHRGKMPTWESWDNLVVMQRSSRAIERVCTPQLIGEAIEVVKIMRAFKRSAGTNDLSRSGMRP